jgi:translation initiation factor 2 alpha subunit (eIF-2alpha)
MSLSNCRFYEEKYPEVDSFVMVNVKQVGSVLTLRAWINVRDDVANAETKFKDCRNGCLCQASRI